MPVLSFLSSPNNLKRTSYHGSMWTQFKNQVTKLYIQHDPNLDADRREEREGESAESSCWGPEGTEKAAAGAAEKSAPSSRKSFWASPRPPAPLSPPSHPAITPEPRGPKPQSQGEVSLPNRALAWSLHEHAVDGGSQTTPRRQA